MNRLKRGNKKNIQWWKWGRFKESRSGWFVLGLLGFFIGLLVMDFIVMPLQDWIQEDDIQITICSTINIYKDEYDHYMLEGEFTHLSEEQPYFRDAPEIDMYICDIILPPIPNEDVTVDLFGPYSESKQVEQSVFIYSKGTRIEDFTCKMTYGYPIIKVNGTGSKSFEGNSIIIDIDETLPGFVERLSDKNFPITIVKLDTNNSINFSNIIVDFEAKFYRKGIFHSYWKEIPQKNFIHWGMIATDLENPFDFFREFFPDIFTPPTG